MEVNVEAEMVVDVDEDEDEDKDEDEDVDVDVDVDVDLDHKAHSNVNEVVMGLPVATNWHVHIALNKKIQILLLIVMGFHYLIVLQ